MATTENERRTLGGLNRQALAVGAAHDRHRTAKDDLARAREELLREMIANIRPALAAVSDQVRTDETKTAEGESHQVAPWVGLRVVGDGPRLKDGKWHGRDLFLRPDGTFAELVYGGEVKGLGVSRWGSVASEIDLADVVFNHDLSAITTAVTVALVREAGGHRVKAADRIAELATRLRALTTILRSWSL